MSDEQTTVSDEQTTVTDLASATAAESQDTHSAPKASPTESESLSPKEYNVCWRRDNGDAYPPTLHVLTTVTRANQYAADNAARAYAARNGLDMDVAAVPVELDADVRERLTRGPVAFLARAVDDVLASRDWRAAFPLEAGDGGQEK